MVKGFKAFIMRGNVVDLAVAGVFINALQAFLFIAAAIYFFVVAPLNALASRRTKQEEATTGPCPFCTSGAMVEFREGSRTS
jgi:large-conductance mechanosensitive channel